MDQDLYDEFGNYIGPDIDVEGSEHEEEQVSPLGSSKIVICSTME